MILTDDDHQPIFQRRNFYTGRDRRNVRAVRGHRLKCNRRRKVRGQAIGAIYWATANHAWVGFGSRVLGGCLLGGKNGLRKASSKSYPSAKSARSSDSVFASKPTSTMLKTNSPKSSHRLIPHDSKTVMTMGPNRDNPKSRIPWTSSCPMTCRMRPRF